MQYLLWDSAEEISYHFIFAVFALVIRASFKYAPKFSFRHRTQVFLILLAARKSHWNRRNLSKNLLSQHFPADNWFWLQSSHPRSRSSAVNLSQTTKCSIFLQCTGLHFVRNGNHWNYMRKMSWIHYSTSMWVVLCHGLMKQCPNNTYFVKKRPQIFFLEQN